MVTDDGNQTKEAFAAEVARGEADLNLAYAASLISENLSGDGEAATVLAALNALAEAGRGPVWASPHGLESVNALNQYLFEVQGFEGNVENYYHPNNSFLNKVLEHRKGIPISLSVVYLEVGWRLGLPLWGISMPGHFIVGYGSPAAPIYIDVFHQGQVLTVEDCLQMCQLPLSDVELFRRDHLQPVTKMAILARMLLNLRQIYLNWEDWAAAYRTVDLMLSLQPDQRALIRDRGLLAYRLGRLQEAIFDIQRYLFLAPDSADREWLERHVERMEAELQRLN
jgi:regulator of sirC expression with transglutaminase-like and TPR domain